MSLAMQRRPRSTPPARIKPLAVLPVFLALESRAVVLAGEGEGLVWKAELLAAAGAHVRLHRQSEPCDSLLRLAQQPPAGAIDIRRSHWRQADFSDAALAVGDFDEEAEAQAFRAAARAAGVPVNLVDRPALCDFQFGAIVNRSPLVIGISTAGAAPVFGQAIRTRIEALLPQGFADWAQAAREWRPKVQMRGLPFRARRLFWERFTAQALARPAAAPQAADRAALLADLARSDTLAQGRVSLVGAGPGDPELLTLKAVRTLQSADIILHDDLVSSGVLDLARREARRMLVGKTGHGPACKQSDINALILKLAREGKHVVRLKSGDPGIFGRASEEIEACLAEEIPVEIIPGITSAQGAAAALGLSLTQRIHARRVQFLTGHGAEGTLPADMNWSALADPAATSIVYMPRRTLRTLLDKARAAGLDPATPAIAIQNATRPEQIALRRPVAELAEAVDVLGEGPLLVMIGRALAQATSASLAAPQQRAGRAA